MECKWRRKNYDLHNVLGFYMTWIAIFIAITGLVLGSNGLQNHCIGPQRGETMVEHHTSCF